MKNDSFKSICSISSQCKDKDNLIGFTAHIVLYYNPPTRQATSMTLAKHPLTK